MDTRGIVLDFIDVATLAGVDLHPGLVTVDALPAPHRAPRSLPQGKMAVYAFFWDLECLKVGKVGPKSQARYTSQHYNPNCSSGSAQSARRASRGVVV